MCTVPRSPSALSGRGRGTGRSASSTPERRSASPARDEFVVHRQKQITTLAAMVRRDDDGDYVSLLSVVLISRKRDRNV